MALPKLGAPLVQQGERALAWQKEHSAILPWVFPRPDGRRIGQFHKEWTKACKAAGLPGKLVHEMRRNAVRRLIRAGVTEKVAMTLVGFKTRAVMERYNIVGMADLDDAVAKLARKLAE
jgi:integrase